MPHLKLWRRHKKTVVAVVDTTCTLVAAIAQASPDPVVSAVLSVIVNIKEEVDKVIAYKDKCSELVKKCAEWLTVYYDNYTALQHTALESDMEEFKQLLEEILTHMKRHNAKKSIAIWFHLRRLSKYLERWSSSLDVHIQKLMLTVPMENYKMLIKTNVTLEARLAANQELVAETRKTNYVLVNGRAPTDEDLWETGNVQCCPGDLPIPREVISKVPVRVGHKDTIRITGYWRKERWAVKLLHCTIPVNIRATYMESVTTQKLHGESTANPSIDKSDNKTQQPETEDYPQDGADIENKDILDVALFRKLLLQEIKAWEARDHPNLLKIYGVSTTLNRPMDGLCVVYKWMEDPIDDWCKHHLDANPLRLLAEAAAGLGYMHSFGAAHGNLRCSNIVINAEGHAMVHDFEIAKAIRALDVNQAATTQLQVTIACCRWMPPEFLNKYSPITRDGDHTCPDIPLPTVQSDVWSFGMTMVELSTRVRPLNRIRVWFHAFNVIRDPNGERPERPSWCTWVSDDVWQIVKDCLCEAPEGRPSMQDVEGWLIKAADAYDAAPRSYYM